jgi:hypothetical protein
MDFPFKRWRLMPSFRPVEVEIVRDESTWRGRRYIDSKGKRHHRIDMFDSKAAAITYGRSKLALEQKALDRRQARVSAKRAALDKADT